MNRFSFSFFVMVFFVWVSACTNVPREQPENAVPTSISQTTTIPTDTPAPTRTMRPTQAASATPRPTRTPSPTPTGYLLIPRAFFAADATLELPSRSASTHRYIYAQTDPIPLNTSLVASYTVLRGEISIGWDSNIPVAVDFNSFSAVWAQVYDKENVLLAEGPVTAHPRNNSGVVLIQGDAIHYEFSGYGEASFDASSKNGLGDEDKWESYATLLYSDASYDLELQNAAVTVGEQTYQGDLRLVIPASDTCPSETGTICWSSLSGSGHIFTQDFTGPASILLLGADVIVGPSSVIGGTPPHANLTNPYALIGYTGWLTLTEYTTDRNQLDLDGIPNFDFGLQLIPFSSVILPSETAHFQTQIFTSHSGDYTIDVIPPAGWQAQVDDTGWVTIQPAFDAVPGVYTVTVLTSPNPPYELARGWVENEKIEVRTSAIHRITIYSNNNMALPDATGAVSEGPSLPKCKAYPAAYGRRKN